MDSLPIHQAAIVVDVARDHVAVAKKDLPAGCAVSTTSGEQFILSGEVRAGHRFAIRPVPAGDWVLQYGQPFALSKGLKPGDPVTAETVENQVPHIDPETLEIHPPILLPWEGSVPTFDGFRRTDGRAGVRNWVLIVPTSNCSSHEASMVALQAELGGVYSREEYPNVDGVVAIPHNRGCGCPDMVPSSWDSPSGTPGHRFTSIVEATMRLLANHIRHPNVGAAIVIELGCEKTNLSAFNRFIARDLQHSQEQEPSGSAVRIVKPVDLSEAYGKPVYSLSIQSCGGTRATVRRALELLPEILNAANAAVRVPIPASELVLGLECGGSDAFSGLTANPALGRANELLIRAGGASVISETPEFFGAEHLFARRSVNRDVALSIFEQIRRYREYASRNGASLSENPSPGNKEGGLLNITIKSLGAMAKAGNVPVQGTLEYGEPYYQRGPNGLYLMYGPGYDPESVPGLIASGCQIVAFTTGRGSTLGAAIAPVVKIASNSPMYGRMQDDMDVNAGTIIEGTETVEQVGKRIFDEILAAASGKWVRAEQNGHREFTIWSEEGISL